MDDFGLKVGRHNTVLPTLTDAQPVELQVDVNGRLLVQTDVTVNIDFLGLNGASDDANILVVGTEDGISTGTPHAFRLAADGAVAVQDNGGSLTVDAIDLDIRDLAFATDSVDVSGSAVDANMQVGDVDVSNGNPVPVSDAGGSLTVDAIDLDIRDLSATQDNVAISDGTDSLEINPDGSINTVTTIGAPGTEIYAVTDDQAVAGDGEYAITSTYTSAFTPIAVPAGQTLYIYGWQWACDENAQARIVFIDAGSTSTLKTSLNSSAVPSVDSHFSDQGRIEVIGGANITVQVQIKVRQSGKTGNATASLHARLIV